MVAHRVIRFFTLCLFFVGIHAALSDPSANEQSSRDSVNLRNSESSVGIHGRSQESGESKRRAVACQEGFQGSNCLMCVPDTYHEYCNLACHSVTSCSSNGRCRGKDGTCACYEGWTGTDCSRASGVAQTTTAEAPPAPTTSEAPPAPTTSEAPPAPTTSEAPPAPTTSEARPAPTTSEAPTTTPSPTTDPSTTPAPPCADNFIGEDCNVCDDDGYTEACDTQCFAPVSCTSHGRCLGDGVCSCYKGWGGSDCSVEITTEAPTTAAPTTSASPTTTDAPTTAAPTTDAPTTDAPTTAAPTTAAPTTDAPTTAAATTDAPTTAAPTTDAPTTAAPTTDAPTTAAPTTDAPTTAAATTAAPTTDAPTTAAPTTDAPTTAAPTTDAPTTAAPTTDAPTTAAPTTDAPTTAAPTTDAPTTAAPTTDGPTTAAPTTAAPTTVITTTPAPEVPPNAPILTTVESPTATGEHGGFVTVVIVGAGAFVNYTLDGSDASCGDGTGLSTTEVVFLEASASVSAVSCGVSTMSTGISREYIVVATPTVQMDLNFPNLGDLTPSMESLLESLIATQLEISENRVKFLGSTVVSRRLLATNVQMAILTSSPSDAAAVSSAATAAASGLAAALASKPEFAGVDAPSVDAAIIEVGGDDGSGDEGVGVEVVGGSTVALTTLVAPDGDGRYKGFVVVSAAAEDLGPVAITLDGSAPDCSQPDQIRSSVYLDASTQLKAQACSGGAVADYFFAVKGADTLELTLIWYVMGTTVLTDEVVTNLRVRIWELCSPAIAHPDQIKLDSYTSGYGIYTYFVIQARSNEDAVSIDGALRASAGLWRNDFKTVSGWETYPYYSGSLAISRYSEPTIQSAEPTSGSSTGTTVGVSAGLVCASLGGAAGYLYYRKKKKEGEDEEEDAAEVAVNPEAMLEVRRASMFAANQLNQSSRRVSQLSQHNAPSLRQMADGNANQAGGTATHDVTQLEDGTLVSSGFSYDHSANGSGNRSPTAAPRKASAGTPAAPAGMELVFVEDDSEAEEEASAPADVPMNDGAQAAAPVQDIRSRRLSAHLSSTEDPSVNALTFTPAISPRASAVTDKGMELFQRRRASEEKIA